jgi:hypothetical protein
MAECSPLSAAPRNGQRRVNLMSPIRVRPQRRCARRHARRGEILSVIKPSPDGTLVKAPRLALAQSR